MKCLVTGCNVEVTDLWPDGNPKRICAEHGRAGWRASDYDVKTRVHNGTWHAFLPKDKAAEVFQKPAAAPALVPSAPSTGIAAIRLQLEALRKKFAAMASEFPGTIAALDAMIVATDAAIAKESERK